jgi:hypothetical protein
MAARPQGKSTKSAPNTSQIGAFDISLDVEFEFIVLEFYGKGPKPTWEERRATPYSLSLLSKVLETHSIYVFVLPRSSRLQTGTERTNGSEVGL